MWTRRRAARGAGMGAPVIAALLWCAPVWACPLCKDALLDPGQAQLGSRAAVGYLVSIVALLGVPTLMVAAITIMVVRAAKRAQRGGQPQGSLPCAK